VLRHSLILPFTEHRAHAVLKKLKCYPLFKGFRGKAGVEPSVVINMILKISAFAESHAERIIEMEINPLLVLPTQAVAVDAVMRCRQE